MFKYFPAYSLFLVIFLNNAFAGELGVVEQVGAGDVKFINKTPEEIQDDAVIDKKNTDKTNIRKTTPPVNLAVPERERTNIIINQQNLWQNKANVNNITVEQSDKTEELLKEEKKNVKRTKIIKKRKKSKRDSDEENR